MVTVIAAFVEMARNYISELTCTRLCREEAQRRALGQSDFRRVEGENAVGYLTLPRPRGNVQLEDRVYETHMRPML